MSGHPSCRRLSKEEIMSIEEMTRSGVPPRQILSSLRQRNPKLQAISRTIYNMKVKLKNDNLDGRTMIQALFEELGQGDFTFYVAHDQNGHLTHLFFAHPSSIALTRSYTTVFVMDSLEFQVLTVRFTHALYSWQKREKKIMFGLYKCLGKYWVPLVILLSLCPIGN